MSISFSSNAFYSDGSSLSGWTYSGITISSGVGNPEPSFVGTTDTNYAYINPTGFSSFVGYTILVDMYTSGTVPLSDFYFGCNSSGVGQMFRLEARGGTNSGFATTTSWTSWYAPTSGITLSANTWYKIKIVINSTATNGMSWYFNDTFGGNGTFVDMGGYIGVQTDGGNVAHLDYFDNIAIYPNTPASITFSLANGTTTASQFYINVKNVSSNVPPSTDNTGGSTLTNTGVTIVTDATRGKVLAFNGTSWFNTNYTVPVVNTRLFWVNITNYTGYNNNILSCASSRPLWIGGGQRYCRFQLNSTVYSDTANTISTGVWYLYALTYDGTTANLYRNGNLNLTVVETTTTTDTLQIGAYFSSNFLSGYLDNIRCYNTALSQTQIKNIYNYELANPSSFYFENGFTSIPGSIGYSYIVNPNGLAVYIDFTNPSCYPGSGTTFYNLMDGRAQAITIGSGLSARVSYTSSIGLRLNNSGINTVGTPGVCLSLTTYTVQTISIWYKIYSINNSGSQYFCDARTNPPSGSGLTSAGYAYYYTSDPTNFGSAWNTAYVNGGSAIATSTATWAGTINPTTPTLWRNVTLVSTSSAVTYPTIVGMFSKAECLDCAIAFVLVYNRALSQEENANNYNLLLSKMNALS